MHQLVNALDKAPNTVQFLGVELGHRTHTHTPVQLAIGKALWVMVANYQRQLDFCQSQWKGNLLPSTAHIWNTRRFNGRNTYLNNWNSSSII